MKTIRLKNVNRRLSFEKIAKAATAIAKTNRALVRFEMGLKERRQTFTAGPRKSLSTLNWEWAKSQWAKSIVASVVKIKRTRKVKTPAAG